MKKSLISAAILASAITLSAAPASASTVYNHEAGFVVTGTPTVVGTTKAGSPLFDPAMFQFTVTPGTAGVRFHLRDTDPDGWTVSYTLYNDLNASQAADAITLSGPITSWSWTDDLVNISNPSSFTTIALAAGNYVLKVSTSGSDSSTTEISAVPLPGAALLFGSGLLGFAALRRKQKAKAA